MGERPSILDIFEGSSKTTAKSVKLQRICKQLSWRQRYQSAEVHEYQTIDGRTLCIAQVLNGEMKGYGTGVEHLTLSVSLPL
jgi:hypothetical protein